MLLRVPYPTRDEMPLADQSAYDRLLRERGPVHVFLAIANAPDLLNDFLTFTAGMKSKAHVDARLRELAIIMVGETSGAGYEVAHHAHNALKAGVRPAQLASIRDFESSPEFDAAEKAVLRYSRCVTAELQVPDDVWRSLRDTLSLRQTMDIVFAAAWYNAVARILMPLNIEIEPWLTPAVADLDHP